jgi:hypothetical protein
MMGNTTDAFPQYQELEVTNKSTSGFTFSWNHPLDSNNYFISYVVPFKTIPQVEAAIGNGQNTLASTLPIAQSGSNYGVVARLQDTVDANPQYQTVVVGTNTTSIVNLEWNVATDTSNYQGVYMIASTGKMAVPISSTSITVPLPVSFGAHDYMIVASMQNADAHPQFQSLLITAQSSGSATFGVNVPVDTSDYVINFYAVSLTP